MKPSSFNFVFVHIMTSQEYNLLTFFWPQYFTCHYEEMCVDDPGTKRQVGSAIRPKNSRLVVPPGFILRDTADSSGPDQWILHNLSSYESPESPLSLWV